jgi:hypothetical protein
MGERGSPSVRILIGNLQIITGLYWLMWAVEFLFSLVLLFEEKRETSSFFGLILMGVCAGWAVVTRQVAVASNVFSFHLPGYQRNIRRLVFIAGLVISAIGGFCFTLSQGSLHAPSSQFVLTLCLGLCVTAIAYVTTVAATLAFGNPHSFLTPMLAQAALISAKGHFPSEFSLAPRHHPILIVLLSVSTAAAVWWWMGQRQWLQKRRVKAVGSRASLAVFSRRARSEQERHQVAAWVNTLAQYPAAETYFVRLVHDSGSFSLVRYVWGTIYASLFPWLIVLAARWRKAFCFVLVWLLLVAAAGYLPDLAIFLEGLLIMLALTFFTKGLIGLPPFSSALITGGRRERFYTTILLAPVLAAVVIAIFTLPLLGLRLLAPFLPTIGSGVSATAFHPISPWLPALYMISISLVGLSLCWETERDDDEMQRGLVISLEIVVLFVLCFLMPYASLRVQVIAAAASWLVFILGVRRITMRLDLVKQ